MQLKSINTTAIWLYKLIYKALIFILTIIFYFIIRNLNDGYFNDILNVSKLEPTEYFGLIIGATSSIFGILIAVVLLTYELLTTKKQEDYFLNSKYIINIFYFPISILILSFISYITIADFKQVNNLTIAYYIGFLFVVFLLGLFWSIRKILTELKIIKKLIKDIRSININNIIEFLPNQNKRFIFKDSAILLIKIRQELIQYIIECDYNAFSLVLEELNKKAIELIDDGINRQRTDSILQAVTIIWQAGNLEALRVGNLKYFDTIWDCIEELYDYAAKSKIQLLHYNYLSRFIRHYSQFLIRKGLVDGLKKGVDTIAKSFEINLLENCPTQDRISDLYFAFENKTVEPHYISEGIQWKKIMEFLWLIDSIYSSSIETQNKELFDLCRIKTELIIEEIINGYYNNIETLQETAIITEIISQQTYNAYEANEKKIFEDTRNVFRIKAHQIKILIEKDRTLIVKSILGDISDFIVNSQKNNRLDSETLNCWGAIGRHLADLYLTNDLAQQSFLYVLKTFTHLKKNIEKNQLPSEFRNYNKIKKQVESLKIWLINKNHKNDINIIKEIDKLINTFKKTKDDNDFRIVKWDID